MKLDEAKKILKKNGALVESEFDYYEDITENDRRIENEDRNAFFKLKTRLDDLYRKYESKSKDYINGHIDPKKWRTIKNDFKEEITDFIYDLANTTNIVLHDLV